MKTPERGDVVTYIQQGRLYNALVLAVNAFNESHLGEDGEPQLHLAVVFDEPIDTNTRKPKVRPIGYIPQPTIVHDVVHVSHEFSPEYMRSHFLRDVKEGDPHFASAMAEIHSRRGAGEWREFDEVADLRDACEVAQAACQAAEKEAASLKALDEVADLRDACEVAQAACQAAEKEAASLKAQLEAIGPIHD